MSLPPTHLWGVTGPVQPLEGGHRNQVFKLSHPDGDLVFKSTRRSADALDWLHNVFHQIGPDLCAPYLKASLSGQLLQNGWTCEPFIMGHPVSEQEAQQIKLPPIHGPQRHGFTTTPALGNHDTSGDIDLRAMPSDVVSACRAAWRALADLPTGVVHGDLNPSNLKRLPDGRICLLDWDEARVDARIFDLPIASLTPPQAKARTAFEVASCWQIEPDRARNLANSLMQ